MVPQGGIDHDQHTTVTHFFKIMVGYDFNRVLYLPPAFAERVNHLADRRILIKDSCGDKWSVRLSYVDGSLAFRKGWKKFCKDHNLKEGELLVFGHTKGRHFFVRIYGSSACERINFKYDRPRRKKSSRRNPERNPKRTNFNHDRPQRKNKSSRRNPEKNPERANFYYEAVTMNDDCETQPELINVDSGSIQPHTSSTGMEDPFQTNIDIATTQVETISTNVDNGSRQSENEDEGESRRFCSGFSVFEMENGTLGSNSGSGKDLMGAELATILHPEITEHADKTGKTMDTNASYARAGIAEQTKTRWCDAQIPSIHPGIVCDNTRRQYSGKAVVNNCDTQSMELPNIKTDGPQKTVVDSSDDNLKQPYTRSHGTTENVHTFDVGMERPKRRSSNHNKAAIRDSDTDSIEESKTSRSHTGKGVVYYSNSDGIGKFKTRRPHTEKGVVYVSDSDSMEQPKARMCRTKRGVACDSDSEGMEQLKARGSGRRKVVVFDSDSIEQSKTNADADADTDDGVEQSKTRRFHNKKGLAYTDSNTDEDTAEGVEQPKSKRNRHGL